MAKDKEEKKESSGVSKRKSTKRSKKLSRWSGLILLILILVIGLFLWAMGEFRNRPQDTFLEVPSRQTETVRPTDQGVIIIE